ncbi:MAG: class I mannose-6-phosphate isomerase [Anaerolineae bacterium]|nr:class I mannose-6-phosphate isomerase [Anaerolineae bacterium]
MTRPYPLQLQPEYRDYVWGGDRLRPGHVPTAEAWIVYEGDRVVNGPLAGRTLAEVAAEAGAALLGERVVARTGRRFPLLIKLLDCAQWLSLQVHPNDEQAARLEGPGHFGKTEAWYVLDAAPGAQLVAGLQPGVGATHMAQAIREGSIMDLVQFHPVQRGDTVFIRAGTLHALGPGLLIYEVQQTSDLTYRVYDWGRPPSGGRVLHIDKSLAVTDPQAGGDVRHASKERQTRQTLCQSPYFRLEWLAPTGDALTLDTEGHTFHALTVIEGEAQVTAADHPLILRPFDTVLIPAAIGEYSVTSTSEATVLKASAASGKDLS